MFKQLHNEADEKNLIEQGFTLVELLIVIVIMGILAGIVVFAVGNLTDSADKNACATEADTFSTAVQAYKVSHSNALPAAPGGNSGDSLNGTPTLTALYGGGNGPLAKDAVKYGVQGTPADKQWGYNGATGKVTPAAVGCTS